MTKNRITKNKKCKIKTGDDVIVIAGNFKGKKGKVLEVWPLERKVVVADVNTRLKKSRGTDGAVVRKNHNYPIDISNVAFLDPRYDTATKIGYKVTVEESGDKKKVRVAKKSAEEV